ncbi:MAG TPA: hypothetical protein VL026_11975 [Rhizomicrobium sp.]|nr:hypothetical protein [Rhizomicrobium sp.]
MEKIELITDIYEPDADDFLSEDERKSLTPQIIIDRIRALKPLIAAHAQEAEKKGRPVDKVWKAIRKTGFFYLIQAKRYGGLEATFDEMFDAVMPIAEADPATGWVAAFSVMNPRSAAGYPLETQDILFRNNTYMIMTSVIQPIGKAVKANGGYRVSGRWAWATTVQVADWVSLVATVQADDGTTKDWSFLVPRKDIKIAKTWNAHGLIATGTHHILAEDVFVPDNCATPSNVVDPAWHDNALKNYDYPLYLGPIGPSLSLTIAVPVVGAARGAIEHATLRLKNHKKRGSTVVESSKLTAQVRLAQAESVVHAAELLVRDAARQIYALVGLTPEEQAPGFYQSLARISQSTQLCREAMVILTQTDGTSMHYVESPLGRAFRDVFTGASHIAVDFDSRMESYGRMMLGLGPVDRGLLQSRETRDEIKATSANPFGAVPENA